MLASCIRYVELLFVSQNENLLASKSDSASTTLKLRTVYARIECLVSNLLAFVIHIPGVFAVYLISSHDVFDVNFNTELWCYDII